MALDPLFPTIRLDRAPARPAPTSIPDAVSRALAPRFLRQIPVDHFCRPTERWWLELAFDVRRECALFVEAFEPRGALHVATRRLTPDGADPSPCAPGEWAVSIQLATSRPLEVRVFSVHFEHGGTLRLQPFSESAWREAWRSLYAPEPPGG